MKRATSLIHAARDSGRGTSCRAAGVQRFRRSVRRLRHPLARTSRPTSSGCPTKSTSTQSGVHLGAGLRRELTRGSIGARIELDDLDGDLLLSVRALDYRRHVSERFAVTAFAGAARLDLATPALRLLLRRRSAAQGAVAELDSCHRRSLRRQARARQPVPERPAGGDRPDTFYDLRGVSVYLSRRF